MEGIVFSTENKPNYDIGKIFLAGVVGGAIVGGFLGFKIGQAYGSSYNGESKPEVLSSVSEKIRRKYEEDYTLIHGVVREVYPISVAARYKFLPIEIEIDPEFKTNNRVYTLECGEYMIVSKRAVNFDILSSLIKKGDSISVKISNYIYNKGIEGKAISTDPERIIAVAGKPLPLEDIVRR